MKVCIIGSGAYGISLASRLIKNGHEVICYSNNKEEVNFLNEKRISDKLKGYKVPIDIKFTYNVKSAVKNSRLIIFALPAVCFDEVTKKVSKYISDDAHVLIATKGIENDTCLFLTEIVDRNIRTNKIAVMSGPTFAVDIITDTPIAFTLATTNSDTKEFIKCTLSSNITKFRDTQDIIGVQICGAIKNVMAIASGMLGGMGALDSTKALFLTEALNDIKELIDAIGGNKKTILSYAGFGDILMTCTSTNSRNYSYGKLIGEGKLNEAKDYALNTTVEGLYTLKSIKDLIKKEKVKMPIIDLISDIICGNKDKESMLTFLIEKK